MADDSRVLIAEILIPDRVQDEDSYAYTVDISMMMFAGQERTRRDWEELFGAVGLELVNIWTKEGTAQSVVEARKSKRSS